MLAVVVAVFVPPRPSETVNATENVPDVLYAWLGVAPVAVVPSPKSQAKLRVSLSGSLEPAPLNEMACPTSPPYGPPGLAVGGRFNTTENLTLADPRLPATSSASTAMV